jgi:hypothetical protein
MPDLKRFFELFKSPVTASVLAFVSILISIFALLYSREASSPNVSLETSTGRSYYMRAGTANGHPLSETKFFVTLRNSGGRATSVEDFELVQEQASFLDVSTNAAPVNLPSLAIYCIDPETADALMPYKRKMTRGVKCDFRKRIDTGESFDFPFQLQLVDSATDTRSLVEVAVLFRFSDGTTRLVRSNIESPSPLQIIASGFGAN